MVFVALYKEKGIFDIEFYLRDYEYDKEKMWSEISIHMLHRGIIQFTVDNTNNPGLLEEFSNDLDELRGTDYDCFYDNDKIPNFLEKLNKKLLMI